MTLDEIVGQEVPVAILKRGLMSGNLGHAYLFSGAHGVGKTTTAKAVANDLVKLGGPQSELRILDGEDSIKISDIRELRERASYSSQGIRIWIIVNVERMTIEASNAFLKTLEEPRAGIYFFLTTSKENMLLPTIVSRCQHLTFRRIPEAEICQWLANKTNKEPSDTELISVARLAQGSLGRAWELWDGDLLEHRQELINKLIKIPKASYPEVLGLSQTWPEDRVKINRDLQLFLGWYRDLLVLKNGINLTLYNPDYTKELHEISTYYSNDSLFQIIQQITEIGEAVRGNARIRFCLGYLLLLMKRGALL